MRKKMFPLALSAIGVLLLCSCEGISAVPKETSSSQDSNPSIPSSSSIEPEPTSSSSSEPSNPSTSEPTIESSESFQSSEADEKTESSSTPSIEPETRKQIRMEDATEPLADALNAFGAYKGYGFNAVIDGEVDCIWNNVGLVRSKIENMTADLAFVERPDLEPFSAEVIDEEGEKTITVPYVQASAAINSGRTSIGYDIEDGIATEIAISNRQFYAYLDGDMGYVDITALQPLQNLMTAIGIDRDFFKGFPEGFLDVLFGRGVAFDLSPLTSYLIEPYSGVIEFFHKIQESAVDLIDPSVLELVLGTLTDTAVAYYKEGDVYSIEFPTTYEAIEGVYSMLDDLGFLSSVPEDFDFSETLHLVLPELNEEGYFSLSFTNKQLLSFNIDFESRIGVQDLYFGEQYKNILGERLDLNVGIYFTEVEEIGFPYLSEYKLIEIPAKE